jgi:hypothetical protein
MADLRAFLREAVTPLFSRRMLVSALSLTLLLTVTNIVIALNVPPPGELTMPFIAAAVVRIGGLLVLAVGILRILAGSSRSLWRPDGGFWLYALATLLLILASGLVARFAGDRTDPVTLLISSAIFALIVAPLAPWLVAMAAETPLAWRPRPHMRGFRHWLPQLVFWSLLLVTPLAVLHAWIDTSVMRGVGGWFWPAMLFDGPLSIVVALLGFGLNAAAYRRVARR